MTLLALPLSSPRRLFPLTLAGLLCAGLFGCSKPVEFDGTAETPPAEQAEPDAPPPAETEQPAAELLAAPEPNASEPPSTPPPAAAPTEQTDTAESGERPAAPVASADDLDAFFAGGSEEPTDAEDRYAMDSGGPPVPPAADAPSSDPPLWKRDATSPATTDQSVSEYFGDMIEQGASPPQAPAAQPPTQDPPPAEKESSEEEFVAEDPLEDFLPAPDPEPAAQTPPLAGLDPAPEPTEEPAATQERGPELEPLPEWRPVRPAEPETSMPEIPAASPTTKASTTEADASDDPLFDLPAPDLPTSDEAEPPQPEPEHPEPNNPLPNDQPTPRPAGERLPPPSLTPRQPPKRPAFDVHNTRHLAWLLGAKLSLAVVPQSEADTWEIGAISEMLGVESVPLDTSGAPSQATSRLLKSAGVLGERLARKHGPDHAALLEIAVKSNALAALYEAHPKLAGPVSNAIEKAAGRTGLEPAQFAPFVKLLRSGPSADEVRDAVFTLHQSVGAELLQSN